MSEPLRKRRDCVRTAPLPNTESTRAYPADCGFQVSLEKRVGRIAAIGELMSGVLALTLAQGTSVQRKSQCQGELFDNMEGSGR